jgi:hypothetical protein
MRKLRAAEALGTPDEPVELLFDVEKEVPQAEFEKYKQWLAVEGPDSERDKKLVVASAWYGLLHPEYKDLMRDSAWLKEFWIEYFADEVHAATQQHLKGNRISDIRNSFDIAGSFVQVFPESRADLKLTEHAYDFVLENFGPDKELTKYSSVIILLELWPERREKIMAKYFPEGAPTELGDIHDNWSLSTRLLLFPELRVAARSHIKNHQDKYVSEIAYWRELFESGALHSSGAFNDYLKYLAILSAERAWIDDTGMEHIEMPHGKIRRTVPLPDRPQV